MTMKMKDVTVGMLFIDTRDGRKVFVTGKNPKYKTLEIQYEGEEPKNTAITTFNKHFQLVTKETERVAQEQELETVEAPQEVEEVQPEPEKKVEKKERKPHQKKENPEKSAFTLKIKQMVEGIGGEFRTWEKLPSIFLIKVDGKSIVEVRYNRKGYRLAFNPNRVPELDIKTVPIKYYLKAFTPEVIPYTDTEVLEAMLSLH